MEKVFLEISQNSQENISGLQLYQKETLPQLLSCEFCEISNKPSYLTFWVISSYFKLYKSPES